MTSMVVLDESPFFEKKRSKGTYSVFAKIFIIFNEI